MGVVDRGSGYFGFLIEQSVCAHDIWMCDHEFGCEIGETDSTQIFSISLAKWILAHGANAKLILFSLAYKELSLVSC